MVTEAATPMTKKTPKKKLPSNSKIPKPGGISKIPISKTPNPKRRRK